MMKTLEQANRELEEAQAELEAARAKVSRLREERDKIAVESASHPWLGKSVKRTSMVGYGSRKKSVTNRGTVAIFDPQLHRGLRNVGGAYGIKAGDPIVVHPGGNTGWELYDPQAYPWELDETPKE
jgi:hypothetical protein